jgi:hypothetical protein
VSVMKAAAEMQRERQAIEMEGQLRKGRTNERRVIVRIRSLTSAPFSASAIRKLPG